MYQSISKCFQKKGWAPLLKVFEFQMVSSSHISPCAPERDSSGTRTGKRCKMSTFWGPDFRCHQAWVDTTGAVLRLGGKAKCLCVSLRHIPRASRSNPKRNRLECSWIMIMLDQSSDQLLDARFTLLFNNNTICESCWKQIKLLSSTRDSTVWLCFAHFHRRKTIKLTGALRHEKISADCFFLLHNTALRNKNTWAESNTNYRQKPDNFRVCIEQFFHATRLLSSVLAAVRMIFHFWRFWFPRRNQFQEQWFWMYQLFLTWRTGCPFLRTLSGMIQQNFRITVKILANHRANLPSIYMKSKAFSWLNQLQLQRNLTRLLQENRTDSNGKKHFIWNKPCITAYHRRDWTVVLTCNKKTSAYEGLGHSLTTSNIMFNAVPHPAFWLNSIMFRRSDLNCW